MLERKTNEIVIGNIAGIPARYHLLEDKTIFDDESETILSKLKIGEENFYEMEIGQSKFLIKEAVLIQAAYSNSKLPHEALIGADVIYIDNDKTNVDPSNLIWDFSKNDVSFFDTKLKKRFKFIPGYTRYGISEDGDVINYQSRNLLAKYTDEAGYLMFGITPDVGKRTIAGQHRLLALAFLKYDARVCRLDVNHVDGNKSNNCLKNLEWANRKRNCDHAYSTGLRTDNCKVLVRNSFTGFVREYYSLEEAARQLDLDGETIRIRVESDGQKVYTPGLQFKKKNSTTEWKVFDDFVKIVQTMKGKGLQYDLYTEDEEFVGRFDSCEAAKRLGLGMPAFYYHASRGINRKKLNGFIVRLPDYENIAKSAIGESL